MFSTTEITSHELISDNPIHQRLLFAYIETAKSIGGNLLEIGCGVGRGVDLLIQKADKFTAIDKNKQLLEALAKQYPTANFIHQNIPPLQQIPDNTFDFIVSFQVIEHIQKDDLFIKEIHRVLKKGGQAIITTPNKHLSLTRNPWHIREYTAPELTKLVGKYFDQITTKGVQGNEKVLQYYQENKKAVEKITQWDFLQLQYLLPRQVLQIPYDLLNRLNRKGLHKQHTGLVAEITYQDYFLTNQPELSLDLFYILTK